MTRRSMLPVLTLLALAIGGCALFAPPPLVVGQTEAEVQALMGRPTARYAMDGGLTRLEYATGPYGRFTWMVDLGADGRSRRAVQVLTTEHFADFQARAPGMTVDQLLRELGRPGERTGGGLRGGELWSWRYHNNDCLLWQVGIGDDGKVIDAGYGIDQQCDVKDRVSLMGRWH